MQGARGRKLDGLPQVMREAEITLVERPIRVCALIRLCLPVVIAACDN